MVRKLGFIQQRTGKTGIISQGQKARREVKKMMMVKELRDLIEGRFDIAKVVYVDRKDDGSTIFGKAAEFSESTIKDLFKNGYKEALDAVDASYIHS